MNDIVAMLRGIVRHELESRPSSDLATIEKIYEKASDDGPENYECDVKLRGRQAMLRRVPLMTSHLGSVAVPAIGDLVLIEYIGNDHETPVILGRFYNEGHRAPDFAAGQIVTRLPPKAGDRERIDLDFQAGVKDKRQVCLKLPNDICLTVTDTKIEAKLKDRTICIDSDAGQIEAATKGAKMVIGDNGDISIQGDGKISIEAAGDLTLKADGNVDVQSGANTNIKGSVINLN